MKKMSIATKRYSRKITTSLVFPILHSSWPNLANLADVRSGPIGHAQYNRIHASLRLAACSEIRLVILECS